MIGRRSRRIGVSLAVVAVVAVAAVIVVDRQSPRRACFEATTTADDREPPSPALGVAGNLVWDLDADAGDELAAVAGCGFTAIREDLLWEAVEPEPGVHDWVRTDAVMTAAAGAGVGVLGILGYSAPWASTDPDAGGHRAFPPDDVDAFARYAGAVAARYGPSSSFWDDVDSSFRPLIGLEIWNEAWAWWAWRPDPDPARYAALARATAEAIRAGDPDITVVLTADPFQVRRDGSRPPWFEQVLDADPGLPELVDVYAVHPYPAPRDAAPDVARADPRMEFARVALVADAARRRHASRPVWITEIGWSTSRAAGGVTESEQARNLVVAVGRARDEWPFVERVFVYTWARDRLPEHDLENGFGLRRADGSPKPALRALAELVAGR